MVPGLPRRDQEASRGHQLSVRCHPGIGARRSGNGSAEQVCILISGDEHRDDAGSDDAVDQQHRGRLRQRHPGAAGACRSRCRRAPSPRCSAPMAPARRRRSRPSPACCGTERGEVTKGSITFDGQAHRRHARLRRDALGIAQVFEGRRVFEHLTTEENLIAGGHMQRDAAQDPRAASSASMPISRCSRSGASSCPATSPAASSRCWRSAAR